MSDYDAMAEQRAEDRQAEARGDYNSERDEDWAAQEAENREARAAEAALDSIEWGMGQR